MAADLFSMLDVGWNFCVLGISALKGALGHRDNQSCLVSAGTPDLSGRAFHHAGPLPHECGVPPQCPVASLPLFFAAKIRIGKPVFGF